MQLDVKFEDVGRDKKAWTLRTWGVDPDAMLRSIRQRGSLSSREIDIAFADDGKSGHVIVGGFRPVGRFTVTEVNVPATKEAK